MTKLAFVSTMVGLQWGGSEFLWTMAATEAISQGHQVDCSTCELALAADRIQHLGSQGARLYPRPLFSAPSTYDRVSNKIRGLILPKTHPASHFQAIFNQKPDVICISQGSSYDIGYNFVADLYDLLMEHQIPYIFVCQFNSYLSHLSDASRAKVIKAFQGASKVLFVSQQNYQVAEHHLATKIPNAAIIQNPVNIQDTHPVNFPQSDTVSFASVARLEVSFKGQDILFKILSQPQWQERKWKLNLYGTGMDRIYLETLATHYEIGDRVNFMGHVNDIRAVWEENHILLLPSHAEGYPLALMEAMFCGRPAIVSDVGGNAECITEAKTGFIAESSTYKSFSKAMEAAWNAKSSWESMGHEAHKVATAKFDKHPEKSLLKTILNSIETT